MEPGRILLGFGHAIGGNTVMGRNNFALLAATLLLKVVKDPQFAGFLVEGCQPSTKNDEGSRLPSDQGHEADVAAER